MRPSWNANSRITPSAAAMEGSIGRNKASGGTFSTVAARIVGPPQGTMFMTPLAMQATTVSTTGLKPSLR
ncbi:unannotated protein [freshwater metagenome]|uniref:Unannotated protein n=1 Tax=freshwater metagenome TaxID=449393 RepID=A0A6J7IZQ8_9ZZZZ